MKKRRVPLVYGEVLFDRFPDGQNVLGGAPFNVAWHLQAFGDAPYFVSRVGQDQLGQQIYTAMQDWGMTTSGLQLGDQPTGQVDVQIVDNEPQYTITPDCAYDFIDAGHLPSSDDFALLYHGTLALRQDESRRSFELLAERFAIKRFLDVNLRDPWWSKPDVLSLLSQATWAKLNEDELYLLFGQGSLDEKMNQCLACSTLSWLVVTRGAHGAVALTQHGERVSVKPDGISMFVDTVGAGDAFTAMLLHGLVNEWSLERSMHQAQKFASAIVGLRGATPSDKCFYRKVDYDV